jgi:putative oxidoreductase
MAEIAILRRVRESQERERMARATPLFQTCERTALLFGRAIFGGFFLYNGINHFLNREMMRGYSASKGVPYPEAAVAGSGAMLVLGGLSLLAGVRPKLGTSLIGAFLLGVTPKMHGFWNVQDPQQRLVEQINFSKNLALLGGALIAAAVPEPWPARVPLAR